MEIPIEESRKKAFFCNLTIRSTLKNIDDMTFKCPLNWTVHILKDFISKYDQKAVHTYKLESWNLFFGGKLLKDEEKLHDILEKKDYTETFVFLINIRPNYKPNELNNKSKELEEEMIRMKKIYIENSLMNDYHNKLHFLSPETLNNDTNISNLPFLSTLPILNPIFSDRICEIKKKKDSERLFEKSKDTKMPQLDLNVGDDPEHRHYRWKLLTKLSVFYFFFSYMMKGNIYPHLLFFVLFIYYKIQMKDHEKKIRNIQNARINQLIVNLSKKIESEQSDIPTSFQDHNQNILAQNSEEKLKFVLENEKNKTEGNGKVPFFVKYYYMLIEFCLCFVYSFFPTWYIELYIEELSDSYKAIVEKITKKSLNPEKKMEESEKLIESLNTQLQQKKEQLIDLRQKLDDIKNKGNPEEAKDEEESIDPTDNINPDNYKLIQKLQHLHKIEIMKEKMDFLKKKQNKEEEDINSEEGSSLNSDPIHDFESRREEGIQQDKKRSKSLENI